LLACCLSHHGSSCKSFENQLRSAVALSIISESEQINPPFIVVVMDCVL
jgi:hypothetical protein